MNPTVLRPAQLRTSWDIVIVGCIVEIVPEDCFVACCCRRAPILLEMGQGATISASYLRLNILIGVVRDISLRLCLAS